MRAAAVLSFGGPEVLETIEVEPPQAGPGEVRVRVRAAGVQPADTAVRKGWAPPGATLTLPQIPGNEFAGSIDQLGTGVERWELGTGVLGFRTLNCYAELVTVRADQIVRKPESMPWEVAGALSASGQTAHTALEELEVGPGETFLIHAAAGGVGTVAVQLARGRGATVIGTASERNHDYLRSLGAIPVTYGEGLVDRVQELAPQGVDVVLDAIGGDALSASVELVANRSRIGTLVGFDRISELGIRGIRTDRSAARLADLVELWVQDKFRIHISRSFPLEQAADAHREIETGHVRGKVVLISG